MPLYPSRAGLTPLCRLISLSRKTQKSYRQDESICLPDFSRRGGEMRSQAFQFSWNSEAIFGDYRLFLLYDESKSVLCPELECQARALKDVESYGFTPKVFKPAEIASCWGLSSCRRASSGPTAFDPATGPASCCRQTERKWRAKQPTDTTSSSCLGIVKNAGRISGMLWPAESYKPEL